MTIPSRKKHTHAGLSQFWEGAAEHPVEFRSLIAAQWPDLDDKALDRIRYSREILADELVTATTVSPETAEQQITAWERLSTGG